MIITDVEIITNYVLVAPDPINTQSGDMVVSDSFDPQKQIAVTGTVLAAPKRLVYTPKPTEHLPNMSKIELRAYQKRKFRSVDYLTEIEIKPGDKVLFRYTAAFNAEQDLKINFNDQYAVFMRYDQLYCTLDPIKMLNGFILVEGATRHDKRVRDTKGFVIHVGSQCMEYADYPNRSDGEQLRVGHTVWFNKKSAARIEFDLYKNIKGDNDGPVYRVHSKDIVAYINLKT